MIVDDKPRFFRMLTVLGGAFQREVDEALLESWWIALGDLEITELEEAAAEILRTWTSSAGRRFPLPGDLRKLVADSTQGAALEAWEDTLSLARDSRRARHPDPVVETVVRQLGGWQALGRQSISELTTWTRKRFLELYQDVAQSARVERRVSGADAPVLAPPARKALGA